ncbi:MAG: hypothetical protein QY325_05560 [Flavobacteriales bacterium]|nr:MAG: hypothetical protein QY325_05560 [Flavobacteriales bacterium]
MNAFEKRLLLGLGLLILALAILEAMAPKPVDWTPTFSRQHRSPYGARLLHDRLRDLFPEVRTVNEPLVQFTQHRLMGDADDGSVNLVLLNDRLHIDALAADQLLDLVAMGDHVLIAADAITGSLADTLRLGMARDHSMQEDTSDIRFIGKPRLAPGVFRFSRGFTGAHFTRYDTSRTRVMAVDGASRPVLLHMAWGDGRFVLCSAPLALTNYNLLKDRNAAFAAGVLSLLPPRRLLWDEYSKSGRAESSSIARFVLKEPALRWAWFLAQALLALFILVHVRRQQRAIPVITPLRNASRELAETIGRLYWHRGDHADLARKMIGHFKEEVRARTYLRAFAYDEGTARHLAAKTGLPPEQVMQRLTAIARREQAARISEDDLLRLSNELHDFRQLIP